MRDTEGQCGKATVVRYASTEATEQKWDAAQAFEDVCQWAAKGEALDLAKAEHRRRLRKAYAVVKGDGTLPGDYQCLHHQVIDGELVVNKEACEALSPDIFLELPKGALNHVRRHLKNEFGENLSSPQSWYHYEFTKTADSDLGRWTVRVPILKVEDEEEFTFVLAPVLVPEEIDKQGDIVSEDEINETAHKYMQKTEHDVCVGHELKLDSEHAQVSHSYVTQEESEVAGTRISKGTWMVGMRIFHPELRDRIKSGKMKGFSLGGAAETEAA